MDTRRTSFPLIFGISPVSGMPPVSSSAPPPRAFPAGPASAPARVEDHDPAGAAAVPAWEEQLDALARCLSRMDALMAMLEADLERHTRMLAALADPLPQLESVALAPLPPLPPYPDLPAGGGGSGPGGQR
ncbi:hypothetical protein [Frankia gtarii]|uniref:hypothetical protein n=1 Tax=Frankia gtarii TaxID=2950102 RepID=UPI0021C0DEE9|nr:hypothetical protein [Frankia gtarii]